MSFVIMILLSLGNYESKYLKNRHNVGFQLADYLIWKYDFIQNSKIEKKIDAFCFEGRSKILLENLQKNFDQIQVLKNKKDRTVFKFPEDENFTIIKPKTFMNASGQSILKYLPIGQSKKPLIIVIYDDIETKIGQLKFTINSKGSGGHNGIRSIIQSIGTNFIRLKIGINNNTADKLVNFVLSDFTNEEVIILQELFAKF